MAPDEPELVEPVEPELEVSELEVLRLELLDPELLDPVLLDPVLLDPVLLDPLLPEPELAEPADVVGDGVVTVTVTVAAGLLGAVVPVSGCDEVDGADADVEVVVVVVVPATGAFSTVPVSVLSPVRL